MTKRGCKRKDYTDFLINLIKDEQIIQSFIKSGKICIPARNDCVFKTLEEILNKNGFEQSRESIYFALLRHKSELEQYLSDNFQHNLR